jgi:hypothetical protein
LDEVLGTHRTSWIQARCHRVRLVADPPGEFLRRQTIDDLMDHTSDPAERVGEQSRTPD